MSDPAQPRVPDPASRERILVIRLGAMGDVVRTLPAVARLRAGAPAARITWLVEERTREVVAGRGLVDRTLVFPRAELEAEVRRGAVRRAARALREFVGALRAERCDLSLDFHSIARSALLARASGARRRLAYAPPEGREGAWWLATERVPSHAPRSRYARNDALLDALGLPAAPREYRLEVDPAHVARLRAACGPSAPVVLHPGSSGAAAHKRWPPLRFARLAEALARRDRANVVVTAGPGEGGLAREVVDASGGTARLAPATPGFDDLAALLAGAVAFVGADSGPLHVASLVGTPVVQILGPTHPIENEAWPGTPWERAQRPIECSPCRRGCAAAACMTGVEVPRVRAALHALGVLVAPRSGPGRWQTRRPATAPGAAGAG